MTSHVTRRFRQLFAALPRHVQQQARHAFRLFSEDPSHPGLRFKRVSSDPPTYSARVGIGYRALCVRDGDELVWFWIGSHADYDNLVGSL